MYHICADNKPVGLRQASKLCDKADLSCDMVLMQYLGALTSGQDRSEPLLMCSMTWYTMELAKPSMHQLTSTLAFRGPSANISCWQWHHEMHA